MEYRYLGRSGLKVSTITIGTMTFGGVGEYKAAGELDVNDARRIIDMSLDLGVNLIDTANMYSNGVAEEIVGEALGGIRKNDVLIASKVRMPTGDGPNDEGLSRHHIIRECERSLKRLKTDVIDIYYMHQWDGMTPIEETLSALDTLAQQGKIRYAGCSNFSGRHIVKALAASERHNYPKFVTQQIHYSLEAREAEYELLPIAVEDGVGALIWSPLAGGLLSGKYRRGQLTGRQLSGWNEPPIRDEERLWPIVELLQEIAQTHAVSSAQVALAWLLTRPGVCSLVIGGRTDAHFKDNIAAAGLSLSGEELARLDAITRPPLIYPYWHQQWFANARLNAADRISVPEA